MIAINTPYFIGSITAIILNMIIPTDLVDESELEIEATWQVEEGLPLAESTEKMEQTKGAGEESEAGDDLVPSEESDRTNPIEEPPEVEEIEA